VFISAMMRCTSVMSAPIFVYSGSLSAITSPASSRWNMSRVIIGISCDRAVAFID